MDARKILDKLEHDLSHFLINETCKADPTKRGPAEMYKYKGLSINVNKEQKGEEINVYDMCASFQERAVGMVVDKVVEAIDEYPVEQVIVAGGVAANSYLRKEIKEKINAKNPNIEVGLPPLWCCGDNAAMIAKAAAYLYKNNKYASLDLGVNPNWSIEEL